jgi:hypothetical protein
METIEKQYKITIEQCQSMINGVCDGCGGVLVPVETVDNANNPTYWAACGACSKYHWGTPVVVFQVAKRMFENGFRAYSTLHDPKYKPSATDFEKEYYKSSQISGTCAVVRDVLKFHKEVLDL